MISFLELKMSLSLVLDGWWRFKACGPDIIMYVCFYHDTSVQVAQLFYAIDGNQISEDMII